MHTDKPATCADAIARGASVILRGHGRAYAPGATAFRLMAPPERGIDPAELGGWFAPVVWQDGRGWIPAKLCHRATAWTGIPAAELVSVVS